MHRLAAAHEVGLAEIPVVIIRDHELLAAGLSHEKLHQDPWEEWNKLANLRDPRPEVLMRREAKHHSTRTLT